MNERELYKSLLQKIVDAHYPDESDIFEIDGDEIVEDAIAGRKRMHQIGHGEQYGVADASSVKTFLEVFVVAFTGYKTLLEIFKMGKEQMKAPDFSSLIPELERKLKQGGIKQESKAKSIAEDFVREAAKLAQQ